MKERIYELIDINAISTSKPGNARKSFNENRIDELADSIRNKGIIQPVILRPLNNNGKYELIAGERRWRAAKKAGLSELPSLIGSYSDEEARDLMENENLHRVDLNPIEEAHMFKRHLDNHKTVKEIASMYSVSVKQVYQRTKLLLLDNPIIKGLSDGNIPVSYCLLLLLVRKKNDRLALYRDAVKGNLSYKQLRDTVVNLQYNIDNALFNTSQCSDCKENENRQKNLFDGDTVWKGRCINPRCFQELSDQFVKKQGDRLKLEGFKVTFDLDEFDKHVRFGDVPEDDGECVNCRDRIWYIAVGDYSSGEAGLTMESRCSDQACYQKKKDSYMNPEPAGGSPASSEISADNAGTERNKANYEEATSSKIKAFRHTVLGMKITSLAQDKVKFNLMYDKWELLVLYHLILHGWNELSAEKENADPVKSFLKAHKLKKDSYNDKFKIKLLDALTGMEIDTIRSLTGHIIAFYYRSDHVNPNANYRQEQVFNVAKFLDVDTDGSFQITEEYLNLYKKDQVLDLAKRLGVSLTSKQMATKKTAVQAIIDSKNEEVPAEWSDINAKIKKPVLPEPVKSEKKHNKAE